MYNYNALQNHNHKLSLYDPIYFNINRIRKSYVIVI